MAKLLWESIFYIINIFFYNRNNTFFVDIIGFFEVSKKLLENFQKKVVDNRFKSVHNNHITRKGVKNMHQVFKLQLQLNTRWQSH